MRLANTMLSITATIWIIYGSWLFIDPKGLSYAGFEFKHWSPVVEVMSMYGAVEVALGLFALHGVLKPKKYMHSALFLWFMIYTALVVGRLCGLYIYDGSYAVSFGAHVLPDSYNAGALWFLELPSAILLAIAIKNSSKVLSNKSQ